MSEITHPSSVPSTEATVWKGCTSQWVHWQFYFLCVLAMIGICIAAIYWKSVVAWFLLAPLLAAAVRYWVTRCTTYELTTERLMKSSGVFSRRLDNLELYRVRDYTILQPFFLRILGLGNLHLVTSDAANPELAIEAVKGIEVIREQLRKAVEAARDHKRVRQMDVDNVDVGLPATDDLGHHD